ncbi:ATP synthase subunit I [Polynucleobacter sp. AP-Titi-500A-B4]|uniref:ATP synthase subunit I n=1 Tax=Polynucleobacter sp. AP-Titi-500A-B4 TaxID=2576923 RepID=UPI001BFE4DCD|nr:ATP synthase subunit I [Polynucleobacter sp. AP-Titi-500A-B4]QWE12529.1 ATP synthase subunit I [Polynucleobacter sp. AP-Titi-500A-B4]
MISRDKFLDKPKQFVAHEWDELEQDSYKTLTKQEMDALRASKPRNFATINSWWVVLGQVAVTVLIACLCFIFSDRADRTVYTYSALVGGLIGFLPSALFLMRIEAARKSSKSNAGGFLAAIVSGEFIKILATFGLFIGFALKQPDLKWIPLLVAYLATLKCYLLAWFWK